MRLVAVLTLVIITQPIPFWAGTRARRFCEANSVLFMLVLKFISAQHLSDAQSVDRSNAHFCLNRAWPRLSASASQKADSRHH